MKLSKLIFVDYQIIQKEIWFNFDIILRAEKEILMLGKNERESKVILSDENFYIELI